MFRPIVGTMLILIPINIIGSMSVANGWFNTLVVTGFSSCLVLSIVTGFNMLLQKEIKNEHEPNE